MGGMNGWQKLDRAIQYLLNVEECFAADKLDIAKEYKIGDKKRGTKCWQNVETGPALGHTVSFVDRRKDVIQRVYSKHCWEVF